MILKVTAITMSQKGELIFTYLPIRIDTDANSNWFLLDYYEDLDAYINTNNQEMFVHAAEYFSHESDDIKQVSTNNSSVLPYLMQPRDCFNNLVKWFVKKHGIVTQARLTLQTKDRDIIIYIQEDKDYVENN